GAVVHHYLDHRTGKHKRQTLSQKEMMVRYSGFLANRKRGSVLPKVYEALEMTPRKKPEKPGFVVLMKGFLGTDPYIMYPVRRSAAFCRRTGRNTGDGITVGKVMWNGEKAMAADA
ncbi:putative iSPsy3 transposase, partial [Candidatus Erwinia dacicola]